MKKILTFMLVLSLAGCSSGISQADYSAAIEENTSLKAEVDELKTENSSLKAQIEELENSKQEQETKEEPKADQSETTAETSRDSAAVDEQENSEDAEPVHDETEIVINKDTTSMPLFELDNIKVDLQSVSYETPNNNRINLKMLVENNSSEKISVVFSNAKVDNRYNFNPSYYNMETAANTVSIEEISFFLSNLDDYGDIDWLEIDGVLELNENYSTLLASRPIKIEKSVLDKNSE